MPAGYKSLSLFLWLWVFIGTSAFILPKGVIKDIEKRLRAFLWRGTGNSGYPKVAWKEICKPKEEDFYLGRVAAHGRLRDDSIWSIPGESWTMGMEKNVEVERLVTLSGGISFLAGDQTVWDWHESTMLSSVICEGHWHWPLITDMECVEITHVLPQIHGGTDRIIWK
ncbi:UNVERIFIED_CONTAM: hypothetical protein Sindi_0085900, partial [Sesamum indicum]